MLQAVILKTRCVGTATTGNATWGEGYVPALLDNGYTACYITLRKSTASTGWYSKCVATQTISIVSKPPSATEAVVKTSSWHLLQSDAVYIPRQHATLYAAALPYSYQKARLSS